MHQMMTVVHKLLADEWIVKYHTEVFGNPCSIKKFSSAREDIKVQNIVLLGLEFHTLILKLSHGWHAPKIFGAKIMS